MRPVNTGLVTNDLVQFRSTPGMVKLGREVPLVAEVDGATVAARADLLFRLDGKLFVGDYKLSDSPTVAPETARAYREAASAACGEPTGFALISLTGGTISPQQQPRHD